MKHTTQPPETLGSLFLVLTRCMGLFLGQLLFFSRNKSLKRVRPDQALPTCPELRNHVIFDLHALQVQNGEKNFYDSMFVFC